MVVVPAKMGWINKRALLGCLQRLGLASRAELARALGLSQPTTGKIADELLELGIVEEVGEDELAAQAADRGAAGHPPRLGRPGRALRLNRRRARFLAIQLGVSTTSLTLLPVGVDQEDHWTQEFHTPASAEDWLRQLRRAAGPMQLRSLWGVLVSVPGLVDEIAGRVLFSPNLHWTEGVDWANRIRELWDAPVLLVQEERALALGHYYLEPNHADFLLVDFGEGVGGAVIVGGQLQATPLPLSGELGHTLVLGNARPCGCGAVGCIETLVSTRGLMQSYAEAHNRPVASWGALVRAMQGRGLESWLTHTLEATATVIAGALNVLGLHRVVLTGSLTELPGAVVTHLHQAILRGALWARFGTVEVHTAPRRRTAGLVAVGLDRLVLPLTARRRRRAGPALSRALVHQRQPMSGD